MIYLTCDIHHQSLGTGNQAASDITEVEASIRFLEMLEERGLKATYFLTGKLLEEEWDQARVLCQSEALEIGGHTYACFEPSLFHRISKKLLGSYNGPAWYERRDVARTCELIRERTGRDCVSWRNHMYMHGPHTDAILYEAGVEVCSDGTSARGAGPEPHPSGLVHWPLNVLPDHEHLYHAERTPAWVAWWRERYGWSDAFGSDSYYIEEWTDRVLEQLRRHQARGVPSCMLIHPITMYLCDGFRNVTRILDYLASQSTGWMRDHASAESRGADLEDAA